MQTHPAADALRVAAATLLRSDKLYDPTDPSDRMELAKQLKVRLEASGFKLDTASRGEDAYTFQHRKDPGLFIKVYTSIYKGAARAKAADAIRIVMLYQQSRSAEKRVVPMGTMPIVKRSPKSTIETLVERVVQRARDAYKIINEVERCSACQAPRATSKAGKGYCAELCWMKQEKEGHKHSHSASKLSSAQRKVLEKVVKTGGWVSAIKDRLHMGVVYALKDKGLVEIKTKGPEMDYLIKATEKGKESL